MTIPLITVVLDPPEISDPTNFEAKADAYLNEGLPDLADEINATATAMNATATAIDTLIGSAGWVGTSTTSLAVGSGTKSLTTQLNLSFRDASFVLLVDQGNSANFMWGPATYNPSTGAMVVTVPADGYEGTGTHTAWDVLLSGKQGPSISLASAAEILAGNSAKAMTAGDARTAAAKQTLTDASTIAWNLASGTNAKVTITASRIMGLPTNIWEGAQLRLEIVQGGAGSFLISSWNAFFDWGIEGPPTLSTTAGKIDIVYVDVYDASTPKGRCSFKKSA